MVDSRGVGDECVGVGWAVVVLEEVGKAFKVVGHGCGVVVDGMFANIIKKNGWVLFLFWIYGYICVMGRGWIFGVREFFVGLGRRLGLLGVPVHPDAGRVDGVIEFAFRHGGRDYYTFKDLGNIPSHRGLRAAEEFTFMRMGLSREHWLGFLSQCDEYVNGRISVTRFVHSLNVIRDRSIWAMETMTMMRVCGILYFERCERADYVDEEYLREKAGRFMRSRGLGFFLSGVMVGLSRYGGLAGWSLGDYLRKAAYRSAEDLEALIADCGIGVEKELERSIRYQAGMLREFAKFKDWD